MNTLKDKKRLLTFFRQVYNLEKSIQKDIQTIEQIFGADEVKEMKLSNQHQLDSLQRRIESLVEECETHLL